MSKTTDASFLPELLVVELGQRLGAGFCGSLLAELGASVVAIELSEPRRGSADKAPHRDSLVAGKRSLRFDPSSSDDIDLVTRLITRADVIVVSTDLDPVWPEPIKAAIASCNAIIGDVSAFGDGGPMAGVPYSDALVQALAGSLDTSGEPEGSPVLCSAPIIEVAAALYLCSGLLAASRVKRLQGINQQVQAPLFECAIGMLATFLPKHFAGGKVNRIGNHHPGMSPWNTYRTKNGWVLLCAGTDDQWRRVCDLIGRPDLVNDPRFQTNSDRVKNAAEIDPIVETWTQTLSIDDCVQKLNDASISTGPILTVEDLETEPNLVHHKMVRRLKVGSDWTRVPGSVFRGSVARGRTPSHVPALDEDRVYCQSLARRPVTPVAAATVSALQAPLAGVRVLEMGQFTTAPLVGRQLGALGADVVKLEPSNGEPSRHMPPHRDGQGYFFTLSNSEKRVMSLDLRQPGRDRLLEELISKADILVENTKPGTLPRHGFTSERVMAINPKIVYCDISGFGSDTPSAGLGAMDTTIQGMSGVMDLTRHENVPYKTGISIADLHAGQFALVAVLAALEFRDRTGCGQYIDLAMLDAAAWATRSEWNATDREQRYAVVKCKDGHALVSKQFDVDVDKAARMTKEEFADQVTRAHGEAAPVLTLAEAVNHAQSQRGNLIVAGRSSIGEEWPLVACPIALSRTPARVVRAPGALDSDAASVLTDWGVAWRPEALSVA
jgi:crotonobetainyl-CoA:carnitine CoA-transferase CaiB-like acyl-CoA transferase